jgi:hypothetical protein
MIDHPKYASDKGHYVRAFEIIHKDLIALFDYIEPADANHETYSFRVHELLTRACIEVEANLAAILADQDYAGRRKDWKMADYRKVNQSHRLSSFRVKLPIWKGRSDLREPFKAWENPDGALAWYQDYNAAKHDRHGSFPRANFNSLIDAVSGLVALVASQFFNATTKTDSYLLLEGPNDGFDESVASYYRVGFPADWPEAERYEFNWNELVNEGDPFARFVYT